MHNQLMRLRHRTTEVATESEESEKFIKCLQKDTSVEAIKTMIFSIKTKKSIHWVSFERQLDLPSKGL